MNTKIKIVLAVRLALPSHLEVCLSSDTSNRVSLQVSSHLVAPCSPAAASSLLPALYWNNVFYNSNQFGRMSITVSNWRQICDAPTNHSPAKMNFSFSKATRFSSQKQNKSQIYYNISTKNSRRATSFGYGNKYDFTRDQPKSPPPNSYSVPDSFNERRAKGFCFGEGRDEMTKTGPLAETINNKNPGPGRYEPMKKIAKIGYTMRGKIIPPQPEAEKVPGPGSYQDNKFFREDGNVFNSKYHNHKAALFNSGGTRFKSIEDENPGPGCYSTVSTELNKAGKYSVSNLQNSKVRTFGHGIRQTFANRCQTPGPGNYKLPSEFGYYVNRSEYERMRTSGSKEAP